MAKFRELTTEEIAALEAFASEYGRTWKSTLSDTYWYNARIFYARGNYDDSRPGALLHGLRNSHGPSWLAGFKLPKRTVTLEELVSIILANKRGITREALALRFDNAEALLKENPQIRAVYERRGKVYYPENVGG